MILPQRILDEDRAVSLLVEASARQLALPKNRAKGLWHDDDLVFAVRAIQTECDEVLEAIRRRDWAAVVRELGDVGACTGIALWLAWRNR